MCIRGTVQALPSHHPEITIAPALTGACQLHLSVATHTLSHTLTHLQPHRDTPSHMSTSMLSVAHTIPHTHKHMQAHSHAHFYQHTLTYHHPFATTVKPTHTHPH